MFSSLAPARRRLLFSLLSLVLAAIVTVVTVWVTGVLTRPSAKPVSQQDAGPVLLIPGYGGSTASLDQLATYLRALGKDIAVVGLPDSGQGDLNVQAETLASAADAVLSQTKAKSVDIVGYSAGGVVARLWARDYGGASKARRVVTIGSPQHGTTLAALADSLGSTVCPVACQQLDPTSSLLAGLNSGDETPTGPTFVSIWTTRDDVVLPPDSASLRGALNFSVQSVCPSNQVRHGGLPSDPVVQRVVAAELVPGPPVTPALGC